MNTSIITSIKSKKWYRHGHYRNNYLYCEYIPRCLGKRAWARSKVDFEFKNFVQVGWDCFISLDDKKRVINALREAFDKHQDFLEFHRKGYEKDCARSIQIAKKIGSEDYSSVSNQKLKEKFIEWFNAQMQLSDWLWILEFINEFLDEYIREKLQGKVENVDVFLSKACFYEQEPEFVKEEKELRELASLMKGCLISEHGIIDKLHEHHTKYSWLNMYMMDGEPFTFEYYKKKLYDLLDEDVDRILEEKSKEKEKKRAVFEIIFSNADDDMKKLINDIRELLFLKSYRIDAHTLTTYHALNLVDEVAKRLNVSREILVDLSFEEICQGLDSKLDLSDYDRRKKEYTIMILDGNPHRFSGDDTLAIRNAFLWEDLSHLMEVTGQMAYPGNVQGPARIVENELELDKVQEGDILFSPMTNPNYVPIFGKVAAIITDEGGVLCHSAIVSREMKIPCVMGVKTGTRVFKDGDMVEVDAKEGVVRKIS
jgi:phosphohistidine swiveling domain-containing protein